MLYFVKRGRPSRSTGEKRKHQRAQPIIKQEQHHDHQQKNFQQPNRTRQTDTCQASAQKSHLGREPRYDHERSGLCLAPAIERTKKRGYSMQEIVERLHEKDIDIKLSMLTKYLYEYRREQRQKKDTPPATGKRKLLQTKDISSQKTTCQEAVGGFAIPPDTPLDEL